MVDYSKWNHIEISDDEDDTHPNIDTPSLFRWRHQARLERMEQAKKDKEEVEAGFTGAQRRLAEVKRKLKEAEEQEMSADMEKLQLELTDLQKQEEEWKNKEEELKHKEKLTPLNIDTLCKEGWSKTLINKHLPAKSEDLTDEEKEKLQRAHVDKYEKKIKQYGMLKKWDDSNQFLTDNKELVCDETANYMVIWCINLEMEEKHDLMHHVSHQTIVMQFILELAKQMDVDPRACVSSFFARIKTADKTYLDAFNDELNSFKDRVQKRAKQKIEKALEEYEEEERQKRLGPGGLDPVEVFESLPKELQDCFEKQDIPMLQKAMGELPEEDARYHLKRCIESGLWIPDASKAEAGARSSADSAEKANDVETTT